MLNIPDEDIISLRQTNNLCAANFKQFYSEIKLDLISLTLSMRCDGAIYGMYQTSNMNAEEDIFEFLLAM